MTALAGYWSFSGAGGSVEPCERMLRAQRIYGSEAGKCWALDAVALGRSLYRLLPEDGWDNGPVAGQDGRSVLVADVRIDNRAELAAALGLDGPEVRALSDAALLMRCLERWDEEALQRIVGDFAFALWQPSRRRLLLARDYIGQRPLHFHRGSGFFAFASMPKGLHGLAEIPRAPALPAAAEFLALLPEAPGGSFFSGIESVPPGHFVAVTADRVETRRYWDPDLSPLRLRSPGEYEERLRELLDEAVAARLRGAPAVAAHLSAGLDSSAVAATAARMLAPSGGRVVAYTSVPRPGYVASGAANVIADEGPLSAQVAALYPNMEHVLMPGEGRSAVAALDRHFFLYDRPLLNLCNATWADAINDAAKARGLKVMLVGQMGNMGLSHSGLAHLAQLVGRGRLVAFARTALSLRRSGVRWGTVASQGLGPFLPRGVWRAVNRARGKGDNVFDHSAVSEAAVAEHRLHAKAAERGLDFSYRPQADSAAQRLWVLRRHDMGNYQKGVLAGWGIDQRDPTADRRLIEFCLRVPEEQFLLGGVPRGLARRALADRLPASVLGEKLKGYQAADWHEGLTAARDSVSEEVARIAGNPAADCVLDAGRMARLVEEWPEGDWHKSETIRQYRLALLRGVSVGHFVRKASGSNQ